MRDAGSEPPDPPPPGPDRWADAVLAARLLAIDPEGLGGAVLRARASPAREAWLALWARLAPERPVVRVPIGIDDERLSGGLDLGATLAAGRPVAMPGLLAAARGKTLMLGMAERCPPGLAARLAKAMDGAMDGARDAGGGFVLIALDEGAEPEEAVPASLADRLAFAPRLEGVALAELELEETDVAAARRRLASVQVPEGLDASIAALALALGIDSLRAPLMALRAARAAAALEGVQGVGEAEAASAVRLVLAPRARQLPAAEPEPPEDPEAPPPAEAEAPAREDGAREVPDELLLEAVRAALPPDLLARLLAAGAVGRAAGGAAGGDAAGRRGGRPVGARRGGLREGARLDLIETLRAAAPWQPLRRRVQPEAGARVLVRPDDFRVRRFRKRAERVVIFVVDASGSTALGRLAEAKGAIELMLGQAYVARQQVALIAFRGAGAEVLLPPTRSLVATKRRLARLPGGGGTPLAAGLEAALALGARAQARGVVPHLAVLTDGRANVARDGAPGRPQAEADARAAAGALGAAGIRAVVIDTANRPSPPARELAAAMLAAYLPLPRADARALSGAMRAALDGA